MTDTKPQDQVLPEAKTQTSDTTTTAGPTALPPAQVQAAYGGAAAAAAADASTTWVNNQKVTALWSIAENRNSWVALSGNGWVKLANNSDSAVVALTMLGSHAKQMQTVVNCRQEADNMIHEIYAW